MATTRVLSNQDGKQETSAIITSRARAFKDIDLSFTKPFNPFFGANIRGMLFELVDEDSEEELAEQIVRAINNYEPRARLRHLDVDVEPDQNTIRVKIEYQVVNTEEVVTFSTSVSRLR